MKTNTQHTSSPLFILHGWAVDPLNAEKWQPLIEHLQSAGYVVHFLGLPGLSSPLEEVWRLNDYVNWVHQQIQRTGYGASRRPVTLIGHSFGGQLAVRYTNIFPDDVERLILIDSAGIRPYSMKARLKRAVFAGAAKIGKIFFPFEIGRSALYRLARERDYFNASPTLRQTMQQVLADEVVDDFRYIQVPTCLIWGEEDMATPISHAHRFAKGIKGSQLHIIAGARHSPQFTHVLPVAQQILAFLSQTAHYHK